MSATLGTRVERLGAKLMMNYETIGFELEDEDSQQENNAEISIPKQVQKFFMEVPTQYRLVSILFYVLLLSLRRENHYFCIKL